MLKKIISLIIIFLLLLVSCKENVNSPDDENSIPGRRDYVWKIDTLNLDPFEDLDKLWGSSAEDIWAMGSAGLWHFDGNSWEKFGNFSGMNWSGIYGFSSSNIWASTSTAGRIYHYDGSNWNMVNEFNFPGYSLTYITDIYGDSPNNIFAVGAIGNPLTSGKGLILKYNGTNWSKVNIPDVEAIFHRIIKDAKGSGKYYMFGEKVIWDTTTNPPTLVAFIEKDFEFNGLTNVQEIFSSQDEARFVNAINGRAYFTASLRSQIWKYSNNEFSVWKDFSNTGYTVGNIFGRSESDIFCYSSFNNNFSKLILAHFNGTDIQQIYEADSFNGYALFENDIFIISEGQVRGIAHGKLTSK
jgi:hypothetical protein